MLIGINGISVYLNSAECYQTADGNVVIRAAAVFRMADLVGQKVPVPTLLHVGQWGVRPTCAFQCTGPDKNGREISEIGEANPDSLTTGIAQTFPFVMAEQRAKVRWTINALGLKGQILADIEGPDLTKGEYTPQMDDLKIEAGQAPVPRPIPPGPKSGPGGSGQQRGKPEQAGAPRPQKAPQEVKAAPEATEHHQEEQGPAPAGSGTQQKVGEAPAHSAASPPNPAPAAPVTSVALADDDPANGVVVWFGRFKDKTLGQLAATEEGRKFIKEYLLGGKYDGRTAKARELKKAAETLATRWAS